MAEPLGTVPEVAARVGESITTTEDIALATSMLKEASAQVRFHGLPWENPAAAPDIACTIAVAAAARGYLNPSGLKMERGDAVTLDIDTDYRKGASLTAGEIAMLKTFSARGRITSVPLTNPDRFMAASDSAAYVASTNEMIFGSPW